MHDLALTVAVTLVLAVPLVAGVLALARRVDREEPQRDEFEAHFREQAIREALDPEARG